MKPTMTIPAFALSALLIGCGEKETTTGTPAPAGEEHGHPHDGEVADAHAHAEGEEVPLGTFKAAELEIEAAQGHGMVEAGKEGHLVIKLPYKDDGATVVRAWIGTEDRTLSAVGKGEYAPSHDDYDIHAIAPSPLPADAKWWVELEKPDGTKIVGSITPKM
ncbi:MAG: hypothetical protein O3A92_06215 [Verrucomicrobia bacterium]|nr:hypothetical protein [Verrucomicrobiota bacterium]